MDDAFEERPRCQHDLARRELSGVLCANPDNTASLGDNIIHRTCDDCQIVLRRQRGLHFRTVQITVRLRPRPAHGWTFGAVQHPKLNPRRIGHTRHHAVQRVDLANQMPFAQSAYRGIAGHLANGLWLMRQQKRRRAHPRRGRRRFAARMAAANNNNVICRSRFHARDIGARIASVEP